MLPYFMHLDSTYLHTALISTLITVQVNYIYNNNNNHNNISSYNNIRTQDWAGVQFLPAIMPYTSLLMTKSKHIFLDIPIFYNQSGYEPLNFTRIWFLFLRNKKLQKSCVTLPLYFTHDQVFVEQI